MNKTELESLRQNAAARRDRKIASANGEYEAALLHIRGVLELLEDEETGSVVVMPARSSSDGIAKSPTQSVREAIESMGDGSFRMRDAFSWITKNQNGHGIISDQVSTALNRLVASGEVEIVKKGGGRGNPSVYHATKKLRKTVPADAISNLKGVQLVE